MVEVYSQRLGKISPQQFQSALDRFSLGVFIRAKPIPFGLFRQNVFITSTQGEFVLRGVPHYAWQFPTEQFFVEQLHQHTRLPVPYPYLVEPSTDIFGWSFVIMPRLPGISLSDQQVVAALSSEDRLAIASEMARTLAEAHSLTWEYPGKYDPETRRVQPFEQDYGSWVVARIREKLAKARSYNHHTHLSDVDWSESIIADARHFLAVPFTPCAVLGDYGEHNVVVRHAPQGWQVSGVFDLMTAHFGDGEADLSLPVTDYLKQNHRLADTFVQEYTRQVHLRPGFVERQKVYMLNLKLSFWEYWQRERGNLPDDPDGILSFTQWAEPSVAHWNQ